MVVNVYSDVPFYRTSPAVLKTILTCSAHKSTTIANCKAGDLFILAGHRYDTLQGKSSFTNLTDISYVNASGSEYKECYGHVIADGNLVVTCGDCGGVGMVFRSE